MDSGDGFRVTVLLHKPGRLSKLIVQMDAPRHVVTWLVWSPERYRFDGSWTHVSVQYRGYNHSPHMPIFMELMTVEAFNSGFRWPRFMHWMEWNMWAVELAGSN